MARKIRLFDTENDCIGTGCMSLDFISWQIQDAAALGEHIEIDICSSGGSHFDAVAIYDLLKRFGNVDTNNISLAGSAASTIFAAGKKRTMSKYGLLMIHPATKVTEGDAILLAKDGEMLNKCTDNVKKIWTDVTGLDYKVVSKMVDATTWLTADEALKLGFITDIEEYTEEMGVPSNAALIMNKLADAPQNYRNVINKILTKPTPDMEDHTKQVEANTNLLTKVWNRLKSFNKKFGVENSMIHATDLAVGNAAFSDEDLESPAPDNVYVQDKKKITVKDGIITNMDDEEEDLETDLDEIENIVTNKTPYKVENHAKVINHVVEVQNKLKQAETDLAETRALLTDARENLQVSNIALKRTEEEIRASIKSEFEPDGSKRSQRSTVSNRTNTGVVDKKEDLTDEAVMPKSDLAQNMLKRSK